VSAVAAFLITGPAGVQAQEKRVTIGIEVPLTGADAASAAQEMDGAKMAIDEANAEGKVAGYKLDIEVLDGGTATAGQYDPAQGATNARKFVADPRVVAIVGPQMSGEGKAMSAILSEGDLPAISPSSTNPDITDPKFMNVYRPKGKAIYFRMVTTDAYQAPAMANYLKGALHVTSVFILDDSGAVGTGQANDFEQQAKQIGIAVLGRDHLDPRAADYTATLTKIKSLNPSALYYGGTAQAGVKLMKQSYDLIPTITKSGADGIVDGGILTGAGFPAAEGWYCTVAAPHLTDEPKMQDWIGRFETRYNIPASDYTITAYDASEVIIDAIRRTVAAGKEVTRDNIRDAIQSTNVNTLQGGVSFDQNGDLVNKVVSVFQIHYDPKYKRDDLLHQYKYVGVAPTS
jgi:branched-chain amino acid transport system substrate-binding protein